MFDACFYYIVAGKLAGKVQKINSLGDEAMVNESTLVHYPGQGPRGRMGAFNSRTILAIFENFENYFEKYLQDFQVPLEGMFCIATVSLG